MTIKTADELYRMINNIWESIPIDLVNNLIMSFPARLEVCKKYGGESLNGRWTEVRKHTSNWKSIPLHNASPDFLRTVSETPAIQTEFEHSGWRIIGNQNSKERDKN